jgi:predicted metal-dependent hydrolase
MKPSNPSRLVPDEPLPPYTFVPGRNPHPVSDPNGHSHGATPRRPPALDPDHWATNQAYLFGIDLFNAGYYWEAHEQWEALWHACGRRGATATLLKALIHLAAAGVKVLEGRPEGVRTHANRAAELLEQVAREVAQEPYLGLDLAEVRRHALAVAEQPLPDTAAGASVESVFDFSLWPT